MLNVLHVDDDDGIRGLVRLSLEFDKGMRVWQCATGAEALARVSSLDPDLFVLDWMMPDMTGAELLERLREFPRFSRLPVVFLTGSAQPDFLRNLYEGDLVEVIEKPFDPLNLAAEILDRWSLLAQRAWELRVAGS